MKKYEYDVALSFAGEDRQYAEALANLLKSDGYSAFYDEYEQATLWGKNIYEHLSSIYKDKARYCVIFLSQYYAQKLWPNHERQSAQARAFEENQEYILPIRLDDTEIPGFLSTVGYLDLRSMSIEEIYKILVNKLLGTTSQTIPTDISPLAAAESAPGEYVLLHIEDGKQYFIPFRDAHWASTEISLNLLPESPEQVAFLSSLRDSVRNHFAQDNMLAFALREDAAWVSPQEAAQAMSGSQTVWRLVLKEGSRGQGAGILNEVTVNNISSDQIAEMRARRILLNEKLGGIYQTGLVGLANDPTLESFIGGGTLLSSDLGLQIQESPIPNLYKSFSQTSERFLKFARLASVLYLKLSNTVEHILELDLEPLNLKQLQVSFKGRRRQRHINVEPSIIQVNGICLLE